MTEVYVLRWQYYDRSGGEVIQVYEDAAEAETERALLQEHTDSKEWSVEKVPFNAAVRKP